MNRVIKLFIDFTNPRASLRTCTRCVHHNVMMMNMMAMPVQVNHFLLPFRFHFERMYTKCIFMSNCF